MPEVTNTALAKVVSNVEHDAWNSLLNHVRPETGFMNFAWLNSWASTFVPSGLWQGTLKYIVVSRPEGDLIGIIPFAYQGKLGMKIISVPGYYMPFREVLFRRDNLSEAAVSSVKILNRIRGFGFRLGPIEKSSPNLVSLRTELSQRGWTILELSLGVVFYLSLPSTVEEYLPKVSGRAKKSEYYLRKMKRNGNVDLQMFSGLNLQSWTDIYDDLELIEAESWVGQQGEPRFMGASNRNFWSQLFNDPVTSDALKVWILYFNDRPVSFCLILDSGPVCYQLINGYSKGVEKYSTGYIIFREMILDAIASGRKRICFGQGDPGHKGEWGAEPEEELLDLIALKPGLIGRICAMLYQAYRKIRP